MAKMAIHPLEITMHVTATEAKNRFGQICAQAKRAPVFVEKGGRVDSVILSAEQYEALNKAAAPPQSLAQRRQEFNETYKDWIAAQHAMVEKYGVFGEEFRPW